MIGRAWVSQSLPVTVERPLGVLRCAVVVLDRAAEPGERRRLVVGEARSVLRSAQLHRLGPATGQRSDGHPLVAESTLEDRAGGGVDHEVVGVDRAGHDRLAQPRARIDHGLAAGAGDRVGGEHHPGRHGVDHPLHDHGQRHAAGSMPWAAR